MGSSLMSVRPPEMINPEESGATLRAVNPKPSLECDLRARALVAQRRRRATALRAVRAMA